MHELLSYLEKMHSVVEEIERGGRDLFALRPSNGTFGAYYLMALPRKEREYLDDGNIKITPEDLDLMAASVASGVIERCRANEEREFRESIKYYSLSPFTYPKDHECLTLEILKKVNSGFAPYIRLEVMDLH